VTLAIRVVRLYNLSVRFDTLMSSAGSNDPFGVVVVPVHDAPVCRPGHSRGVFCCPSLDTTTNHHSQLIGDGETRWALNPRGDSSGEGHRRRLERAAWPDLKPAEITHQWVTRQRYASAGNFGWRLHRHLRVVPSVSTIRYTGMGEWVARQAERLRSGL